ncbi:MAG TPA: tRNA pseudouridine(55) synthase TruB [Actinomycetota bacterium]|nr:tRNA pseudouridine(55) synthase TruB [Actinomycetota bacterium]
MNGLLIADKPAGMTSHDAVAICRKRLAERKIGHAGTLDPDATGVLVLGVGRATRLLQYLEAHDKTYTSTFVLGVETSTQDASGQVVASVDAAHVTRDDVEAVLPRFRGEIDQVPPMVSAVKVGGEALYKKARRGETVERVARRVTVHELELTSFDPPAIRVRCSKGTYIRTLVHDIGVALGVGAHVATLRRTAVGPYTEADATPVQDVAPESLRPMGDAVAGYPRREVDAAAAVRLAHGKAIDAAGIDGPYAVFAEGALVAMARDAGTEARSLCVLVHAADLAADR